MLDIIVLKLKTGDDLIARLVKDHVSERRLELTDIMDIREYTDIDVDTNYDDASRTFVLCTWFPPNSVDHHAAMIAYDDLFAWHPATQLYQESYDKIWHAIRAADAEAHARVADNVISFKREPN